MGTRLLAIFLGRKEPLPSTKLTRSLRRLSSPCSGSCAVATAAAPELSGILGTAHNEGYRNAGKLTRWSATPCMAIIMSSTCRCAIPPRLVAGSEAHGAFWKSDVVRMGAVGEGRFRSARLCLPEAHENNIQLHAWLYPFRPPRVGRPRSDRPFPPNGKWLMVSYAKRGLGASTFTGSTYWFDAASRTCRNTTCRWSGSCARTRSTASTGTMKSAARACADNWYPRRPDLHQLGHGSLPAAVQHHLGARDHQHGLEGFPPPRHQRVLRRCQAESRRRPAPRQPLCHSNCLMTYGSPPPVAARPPSRAPVRT